MELTPDLITFTDIEASGLHDGSFPIEIGWAGLDLVPHHFLIKPHSTWTFDLWNSAAEQIHGISWEQLQDEGIDPKEAADRIIEAFRGQYLVSDSPFYEAKWFLRLFEAVDVKADFVHRNYLGNVMTHIKDIIDSYRYAVDIEDTGHWKSPEQVLKVIEDVERLFPHTHRASDDAIRMAASFKIIAYPSWDYEEAAKKFLPVAGLKL